MNRFNLDRNILFKRNILYLDLLSRAATGEHKERRGRRTTYISPRQEMLRGGGERGE